MSTRIRIAAAVLASAFAVTGLASVVAGAPGYKSKAPVASAEYKSK
jgi:hypothetical protein